MPVKLDVDRHADALLRETVDEFLFAANFVVDHTWGDGGAPLGVRVNSGTVTANGVYNPPASTAARAGVHAESHDVSRG